MSAQEDWNLAETAMGRAVQAAQLRYWADPEHRAKRIAAMKEGVRQARRHGRGYCGPQKLKRDQEIVKMRAAGKKLAEIGARYGITQQGVSAVLRRMKGRMG